MPALRSDIDPEGLLEYSVVFTDRSLNHMSQQFQQIMRDISTSLKSVYNADAVAVIPGGGTFAMEAVARQLATNQECLVVRNGWFSFRWSQILEMGGISDQVTVMKAAPEAAQHQAAFSPASIDEVVTAIQKTKPAVVFAPHVETSSGTLLPDEYIKQVAEATHATGGLFVLDCIASGTLWVDMKELGVDVLISAPQKGWSATPCAGLVMMNENATAKVMESTSSSFACDLKKWLQIMNAYENGGHAYHATMPTDGLKVFRDTINEMEEIGFGVLKTRQIELGKKVRELLASKGFKSVAAQGYEAPGVVVSYTDETSIHNGSKFAQKGMQIAAGVPLQCDEPADYQTFRIGLFGLDKLQNVDRTVDLLKNVLDQITD